MTRLLSRPKPITVEGDDLDCPRSFYFLGQKHPIAECIDDWTVEESEWHIPICRDYFEVYTTTGYWAEIFRDALTNQWYVERLHA